MHPGVRLAAPCDARASEPSDGRPGRSVGVADATLYLVNKRRTCVFLTSRAGSIRTMVLHIIGLIVLGLLVGALGRLFHPGRDRMGILMTMAIGVASVVIAGLLIGGLLGFILAVIIGVVLVALWSRLVEARRAPKWKRTLHVD